MKLWGNLTFNPISALSRATLASICQYPPSRAIAAAMMTEAEIVAKKLGITFRVPLEKRINGAERVGHHKTSMLQDVESARTLEIDALLGSVVELARLTDTADSPHRYGLCADETIGENPGGDQSSPDSTGRRRRKTVRFGRDPAEE